MILKVCCIQNLEEALACINTGVDMIGFVSQMPTGFRLLADDQIRDIIAQLPHSGTRHVLLSSKKTAAGLINHAKYTGADTLQIVDYIDTASLEKVRQALPDIKLIQVIHVVSPEDVIRAQAIESLVDYILLDSGKQRGNIIALGGTGTTHDWSISASIVSSLSIPVLLAGGLNLQNVEQAISVVKPAGIDICTGLRDPKYLLVDRLQSMVELLQ